MKIKKEQLKHMMVKIPIRVRPISMSLEAIINDPISKCNFSSYKLMYGKEAANKILNAECKNKAYSYKINTCEYFIKELLDEVKSSGSDNKRLIEETEQFLLNIERI